MICTIGEPRDGHAGGVARKGDVHIARDGRVARAQLEALAHVIGVELLTQVEGKEVAIVAHERDALHAPIKIIKKIKIKLKK